MPSVASKLAVELEHISRLYNGRVPIVSGRGVCTISLGNQLLVQEVRRWQPYYFSLNGPGCNALKKEVQLLLIGWAKTQGLVFIFRSEDGTFHEMSNEAKRDKVARLLGERPRVNNIDIPPPSPPPQAQQAFNVTALAQRPVDHRIDPIAQQQQLNPGERMANMRDGNANVMDLDFVQANADDDDELSVDVIHNNNADDIDQEIADRFGNFGDQLMEERPMEEEAAAAPPLDIIAELDGFRIWDGMEDIVDHLYDRYHGLALVPMPWLEDADDFE